MLKRKTTGSVVCRSCGLLVGVNASECFECGCRNPGLWGYAPLLRALGNDLGFLGLVTWGCVFLYLAALAVDPSGIGMGGILSMLSPSRKGLFLFGSSGALPVFEAGRWWTVLSAAWLHGSLLHIGFNLMWVRQLAPTTAMIYGPARLVIIYTVSSIIGFSASSWAGGFLGFLPGPLRGAGFTVGASAPIFGLLGALIYAGRRGVGSAIGRQAQSYAIILFVLGLIMPNIDNWAHAGGFLGGYLTSRWLDPMQPERLNHLVAGVVCIALTILSIVASVVTGLQYV